MEITEKIEKFQDSHSIDILEQYLRISTPIKNDHLVFSKLEILNYPPDLKDISSHLSTLVPINTDYICALAPSGIPLGVGVSFQLNKPLVLYNPAGWERKGISRNILPEIPLNKQIVLVDAHVRTGRTSSWCRNELQNFDCSASRIVTPVIFDICHKVKSDLKVYTFGDTKDGARLISSIHNLQYDDVINQIADIEGAYWSYPPSSGGTFDEYKSTDPYSIWPEYVKGLSWFFKKYPDIEVIDETKELFLNIPSIKEKDYEYGVWELLSYPDILKTVSGIAGLKIQLEDYDIVLGIGHLGLVLAIMIVLSYLPNFHGKVVAWLGEYGIIPNIEEFDGLRILPVTMRAQYGTYILDVLRSIKKRNGKVENILVGVKDFRTSNSLERLRQVSLSRLRQQGIKLTCLSSSD